MRPERVGLVTLPPSNPGRRPSLLSHPTSSYIPAHADPARQVETVRRDLLDHVIVLDERHLQRLLSALIACYHDDRTHLGLAKGTPSGRQASPKPIGNSEVVALPRIGGLHHRYEWRAAA